jgi:hypothetical protein
MRGTFGAACGAESPAYSENYFTLSLRYFISEMA